MWEDNVSKPESYLSMARRKNGRVTQVALEREGKEGAIQRRGGEINKTVGKEREGREDGEEER